ncbi:MAG: hypothetical protein ABJD13_09530 [Paracoccaceae bacterium]
MAQLAKLAPLTGAVFVAAYSGSDFGPCFYSGLYLGPCSGLGPYSGSGLEPFQASHWIADHQPVCRDPDRDAQLSAGFALSADPAAWTRGAQCSANSTPILIRPNVPAGLDRPSDTPVAASLRT